MSTLIGGDPIAPAVDNLIAEIKSSAHSSWEVSILCASDVAQIEGSSDLFEGWKSILHVTAGSNYDQIGSRVFAFWRNELDKISIGNPIGATNLPLYEHLCVENTYSTYKIEVSPHKYNSTLSIVLLYIDDVLYYEEYGPKVTS